jgi:prepilin-type processing-associated H-X9-DG protein
MRITITRPIRTSRTLAKRGMTLVEILCVTVAVTLIILAILPAIARSTAKVSRIKCVNNLKNIGLAFRIFATDNDGFPFQVSTNQGGTMDLTDVVAQFQAVSNELSTPKIILCPGDYHYKRRKDATDWASLQGKNISYYVGIDASETNAASILSGDHHFKLNGTNPPPGLSRLSASDSIVYPRKFHPEGDGANILFGDGGVHRIGSKDLPKYLTGSGIPTNRFILP